MRTIAIMRLLVGLAALLQAIHSYPTLASVFDESTMRFPFVSWLPTLSPSLLAAFAGLWCLAAVAFAIGWHYRVAGSILMIVMAYSILVDQQGYSNHVYLLILVVGLLSIAEDTNGWPATLMRCQLSIVYFFAAASKLNLLYISGAIIGANLRNGWLLPLPEAFHRWEVLLPIAMTSILLEVFLAFAFWIPRYRTTGLVAGILFHLMIVVTFPGSSAIELIVFGLTMLALYLLFIDPVFVVGGVREAVASRRVVSLPALKR